MISVTALIIGIFIQPPDTLSLEYCYERINKDFPLQRQMDVQRQITDLKLENVQTEYYPQISVGGRATYQSDVTSVNFTPPNVAAPSIPKDQYRLELNARQLLYGGGRIELKKKLRRTGGAVEEASVEKEMHRIRELVDKFYFGIVNLRNRKASLEWVVKMLDSRIESVKSMVRNGVLLPSDLRVLQAERIKTEQRIIEMKSRIEATVKMLGEIIDENLAASIPVKTPDLPFTMEQEMPRQRPEYELFSSRKKQLQYKNELTQAGKWPTLSAFGTTAYGQPGLDMFNTDFQYYYLFGIQLRWNFWEFWNADREMKTVQLEKQKIEYRKQSFTRQLNAEALKERKEIEKLDSLIEKDRELIELRKKVARESERRLDKGTITSSDYVEELYEVHRAKLKLKLHKTQRIQSKIQYLTKLGIPWKQVKH